MATATAATSHHERSATGTPSTKSAQTSIARIGESSESPEATRLKRLTRFIGASAEAMGTELSPEALKIFVQDLAHLPDEAIRHGVERTRREVKGSPDGKGGYYPPKLMIQDVLDRAGVVTESSAEEMEGIAAWDTVTLIADRFLREKVWEDGTKGEAVLRKIIGKPLADCENCKGLGRYLKIREKDDSRWVADCSCRPIEEVPTISDRIEDVVRRMGGWVMFKDIKPSSFPFVRRDFMLEFGRWKKVENYRSQLPAGESMLALGQGGVLATEDNTPHPLEVLLDNILTSR